MAHCVLNLVCLLAECQEQKNPARPKPNGVEERESILVRVADGASKGRECVFVFGHALQIISLLV